ncbi:MAG: helix-turn-helix transcriptional regulator [Spirochaetales bacterium]|jgi:DNA-binding CsgD family transcriptional regulator|nr:helix-turn-helix transcriptional regulator [Spirochaetales bacterium]
MGYQTDTNVPWSKINDFLLDCGRINNPRDFSIRVLQKLDSLIPYDQGHVYFLDYKGKVVDEFLVGTDPQFIRDYHEYYSKIEGGRYSVSKGVKKQDSSICEIEKLVYDWTAQEDDEFISRHLRPYGIRHTFGLGLYDIGKSVQSAFILNRVSRVKYTIAEMRIIANIRPHLNNLFKNFFYNSPGSEVNTGGTIPGLTARESEIALLLCKGFAPVLIGKQLCISLETVYKHIAHIHAKMKVSTQQELLVKLYSGHLPLPS